MFVFCLYGVINCPPHYTPIRSSDYVEEADCESSQNRIFDEYRTSCQLSLAELPYSATLWISTKELFMGLFNKIHTHLVNWPQTQEASAHRKGTPAPTSAAPVACGNWQWQPSKDCRSTKEEKRASNVHNIQKTHRTQTNTKTTKEKEATKYQTKKLRG